MAEATRNPSPPTAIIYKSTLAGAGLTALISLFFPQMTLAMQGVVTGLGIGIVGAVGKELRNYNHAHEGEEGLVFSIVRVIGSVLI